MCYICRMNRHIELRKAVAAWESIACKRKISWRHVFLKFYKHKMFPGQELISIQCAGAICEPAGSNVSKRALLADLTEAYNELVATNPAFCARMEEAVAIKEAEIRSYGIDPATLSGYRLFGKFDPEDPMGTKDMDD